jgi:hypothetical protein
MDHYTRNVLVVEPNPVERERLAAALEGTGFQVLECSGPVAPDYTCVGARSGRCPLASDESVVVIDMDLNSDAAVSGTSAEELLGFYLEGGHRVVTLGLQPMRCDDDRVLQLRRHPETDELLAAVWWSAAPIATRPAAFGGAGNDA